MGMMRAVERKVLQMIGMSSRETIRMMGMREIMWVTGRVVEMMIGVGGGGSCHGDEEEAGEAGVMGMMGRKMTG